MKLFLLTCLVILFVYAQGDSLVNAIYHTYLDGLLGIFLIITFVLLLLQRKRLKEIEKLSEENNLFKEIIKSATTGVTIADASKDDIPLIYANKTFFDLTGYSPDEILNKNCRFLQGDNPDLESKKRIRDAINAQQSLQIKLKNFKKSGEVFYNLLVLTPIFDKENKLYRYVGIQNDITELHEKEEDLQEKLLLLNETNTILEEANNVLKEETHDLNQNNFSLNIKIKEQLSQLKNSHMELKEAQKIAKLGSWSYDFISQEVYWSEEKYNILELQRNNENKPSYETYLNLVHPDDLEIVKKSYNDSLQSDSSHEIIHRITTKDNKIKWIKERWYTIFNKEQKPIKTLGTIQDITEIKFKEEQLIKSSKMASMGEMLSNIAHQWRQPLTTISIASTGLLFKNEMNSLENEELISNLEMINSQTQYLSQTINTFSNFLKNTKDLENVSLQLQIQHAYDILHPSFLHHNIKLEMTIDKTPIELKLCGEELTEVIVNILNNAKDVLKENNIENPLIKISLSKENDFAIISIEDNGGGIPDAVMPYIFDAYYTTKHKSQGTGLGLYITYQIITQSMGGKIYAKNTDVGVKFIIELPLFTNQ